MTWRENKNWLRLLPLVTCHLYYTVKFIPQFLHNKPAFHNCPIIATWFW